MFKNIRYFYEKTSPPVSRKSWVGIHPRTSMMFGFFIRGLQYKKKHFSKNLVKYKRFISNDRHEQTG